MIAAVLRYLDRTTGAGQHAPRTVARRRHPAGTRLTPRQETAR